MCGFSHNRRRNVQPAANTSVVRCHIFGLLMLIPSSIRAQEAPSATDVGAEIVFADSRIPNTPSCVDPVALRVQVALSLGRDPNVALDRLRFDVQVAAQGGDVVAATVRVVGEQGERTFERPIGECTALMHDVALSIAVAIDPFAVAPTGLRPNPAPAEPRAAHPSSELAMPSLPTPTISRADRMQAERRRHANEVQLSVAAGAGIHALYAPLGGLAVGLHAGLHYDHFALLLGARYMSPAGVAVVGPNSERTGFDLAYVLLELALCHDSGSHQQPGFSISACAVGLAGGMRAVGGTVANRLERMDEFFAVGSRIEPTWRANGEFAIRLGIELAAPLTRYQFAVHVGDASVNVYRTEALLLTTLASLVWEPTL